MDAGERVVETVEKIVNEGSGSARLRAATVHLLELYTRSFLFEKRNTRLP
jgi:hypothetical protein